MQRRVDDANGGVASTVARARARRLTPRARWTPIALLTLGWLALASLAQADGGSVSMGDVSTLVGHTEVVPALKATLARELSKMKPPAGHSYVVNASLVKLETVKGTTKKQAVISLALRDAQGNLRGTVQGVAAGDRASDAEVVEAATRGGSKAVAEFVAK